MSPTEPRAPRRAALIFIFITVSIDIIAFGIIIPVLPKLVEQFMDGNTANAARIYGVMGTVWALMQFVFSPILGALSDRYGRRRVILISCFGLGLDFVLMAMAPSLAWLFVGRVVSGICGASFSTAGAYIADVTPPEKRAAGFGLIGIAFGVGFVIGPALGGVLGAVDPRLPFWVAAGLALSNAMYGLFVLPESLPPERRSPFRWARANPLGSLRLLRSHPELLGLAGVSFLGYLAHVVFPSVAVLYMGYRYGWDAVAVGWTLAGVGICSALVQGLLIRPVVRRWGERRTLMLGLAAGVVGFFIYGIADSGLHFLFAIPVIALWDLAKPAAQSLMSQRVLPSEQGQLQGANSSMIGIAGMIGPTLFTQSFAYFIGSGESLHVPGAPFLIAAFLLLLSLLLSWRVTRKNAA